MRTSRLPSTANVRRSEPVNGSVPVDAALPAPDDGTEPAADTTLLFTPGSPGPPLGSTGGELVGITELVGGVTFVVDVVLFVVVVVPCGFVVEVVVVVVGHGDCGTVSVCVWPPDATVSECPGVRRDDVRCTSVPLPGAIGPGGSYTARAYVSWTITVFALDVVLRTLRRVCRFGPSLSHICE